MRLVIDTDCANEIDDQFALAWALLSPERLTVEATVAAVSSRHLSDLTDSLRGRDIPIGDGGLTLEALGVILEYERLDKDAGEHKKDKAREVADQYRDLVD